MSALCQKRTLVVLFDYLVGAREQRRQHLAIAPGSPWQNSFAESWSDQSVASALIIPSHWARNTCAGCWSLMQAITTPWERIAHWTRMRHLRVQLSGSVASYRMLWLVGCIINMFESAFSVHTGEAAMPRW